MQVRQRNKETKNMRSEFQAQKEAEDRERAERNALNRDQQKQAVRFNKETHVNRNLTEAERLKQERQQHSEKIEMQKKSDELKAQTMKHMIRGQKEEQKELRA